MSEFIELTASGSEQPMFFRKTCMQELIPITYRNTLVVTTWGSTNCKETTEEIMALLEETPVPCLPQPPEPCPDVRFAAGQFLWAMMCVKNRFNVRRPGWTDGRVLNTGNFHHAASMDEGDIFADDWKLSHAHLLSSERQPRTAEVPQGEGENQ